MTLYPTDPAKTVISVFLLERQQTDTTLAVPISGSWWSLRLSDQCTLSEVILSQSPVRPLEIDFPAGQCQAISEEAYIAALRLPANS